MASEQELAEMEERRAKAVKALDVGGIAGAFLCTTPLMEDMPRLIAEVRRLRRELKEALHEMRFPYSQRDP